MPTTRLTFPRSNHSGRMQSKLQRLPLSQKVSTATAWRGPMATQRHPSRMRFPTLARHTPPPKNHSYPTCPTSWQSKGNSNCSANPSEMVSPHPVSSNTNNAHMVDVAVDSNVVATTAEAAAMVAVDTTVVVATRTQTAAVAAIMVAIRTQITAAGLQQWRWHTRRQLQHRQRWQP